MTDTGRPPIAKKGEHVTCPAGHPVTTVAKDFWQLSPLLARFFATPVTSERCASCGQKWFKRRELHICIAGEWRTSGGYPPRPPRTPS
jgi:hypothetical protein